jgi:hypothetical protein
VQNQADPQTLNRFSYCLNNPLKFIDPSGNLVGYAPSTDQLGPDAYMCLFRQAEEVYQLQQVWAEFSAACTKGGSSVANDIETAKDSAGNDITVTIRYSREWNLIGNGDARPTDRLAFDGNSTIRLKPGQIWNDFINVLAEESFHADLGIHIFNSGIRDWGPAGSSWANEILAHSFAYRIGNIIGYNSSDQYLIWCSGATPSNLDNALVNIMKIGLTQYEPFLGNRNWPDYGYQNGFLGLSIDVAKNSDKTRSDTGSMWFK